MTNLRLIYSRYFYSILIMNVHQLFINIDADKVSQQVMLNTLKYIQSIQPQMKQHGVTVKVIKVNNPQDVQHLGITEFPTMKTRNSLLVGYSKIISTYETQLNNPEEQEDDLNNFLQKEAKKAIETKSDDEEDDKKSHSSMMKKYQEQMEFRNKQLKPVSSRPRHEPSRPEPRQEPSKPDHIRNVDPIDEDDIRELLIQEGRRSPDY